MMHIVGNGSMGVAGEMEDRTGQWLAGRYRLDRRLATDNSGDRYEAWDGTALSRVVVHLLAPALIEAQDAMATGPPCRHPSRSPRDAHVASVASRSRRWVARLRLRPN